MCKLELVYACCTIKVRGKDMIKALNLKVEGEFKGRGWKGSFK